MFEQENGPGEEEVEPMEMQEEENVEIGDDDSGEEYDETMVSDEEMSSSDDDGDIVEDEDFGDELVEE